MARLQASLLYGRPAALVHGKILCSMTAVYPGADLGGGCRGCASPPPEMPCDFLIQLVFCIKICLRHQSLKPFLSGAARPKKNPGSPLISFVREARRRRRIGESFVESSYFANHADHRVRIERDRKKRANGYQFQQCSFYQKLKTSVEVSISSLFLEAFQIRESRTSC